MNMTDGGPVRVLLADDDPLFADALAGLLANEERIEVVGRAGDDAEAVTFADLLRPDLVLMDLAMPGLSGLEATRHIRESHPEILVLVLTGSSETEDVRAASEAGAAGFLTKDVLSSDVASAILGIAAFANAPRS